MEQNRNKLKRLMRLKKKTYPLIPIRMLILLMKLL